MKRILIGIITVAGAATAMSLGVTGAFFSDTETSSGNTFAAGDIDLTIDNTSYYNGLASAITSWLATDLTDQKFFNFDDLKPDDWGEDTISIHVDTNDAYMCAEVTLTSNDDNGLNEPEGLVDQTDGAGNGELADQVEFVWWADDGDNVLEEGEEVLPGGPLGELTLGVPYPFALADSETNIWEEDAGPIEGDADYYIGKAWCFGDIGISPLAQSNYDGPDDASNDGEDVEGDATPEDGGITCDGSNLGNETQTDSLTADISFSAVQARNNPNFVCEASDVPPPTFGACSEGQEFANAAGLFDQGRTKAGALIVANRSNPSAAFGAPQTTGGDSDVGFPAGSFVSLGFAVGTTSSRSLVLDFSDNVVIDGAGADLKIYEVTGGVYPDEHVKVEISQDGSTWHVAAADAVRDEEIDISSTPLDWARYVRVTDLNNPADFSDSVADGYDLDAIEALNCGVPEDGEEEPSTATLTLVKVVVNDQTTDGDEQPASAWTLSADGPTDISGKTGSSTVTNAVVAAGSYDLDETGPSNYAQSDWVCTGTGVQQDDEDTVTLSDGDNVTCTITNTEEPEEVVQVLNDSFGTGDCLADIPGWLEDAGESCTNGTVAAAIGSGDNTASPDGSRFALLSGNNGFICRSVNATGLENLALKYYWRGDSDGDVGETGSVTLYSGGTCAAPTGAVASSTHALTTTSWSAQQTLNVPDALENTTFLVKFTANSNGGNESFRIDGVNITGSSI